MGAREKRGSRGASPGIRMVAEVEGLGQVMDGQDHACQ